MDIDASIALATLAQVKEYLNIPDDQDDVDEVLGTLINAASSWITGFLGRRLLTAQKTEYYHGDNSDILLLRRTPVTAISSVHVSNLRQWTSVYLVDPASYILNKQAGTLTSFLLLGNWAAGESNIRVIYTAGYDAAVDTEGAGGLPHQIRLALFRMVDRQYRAGYSQRKLDVASEVVGDRTTTFRDTDVAKDVVSMLAQFKKGYIAPQFSYEE